MTAQKRFKGKRGLAIAIVFTLILGIAGLSFAARGEHGVGFHQGGYGHNDGCRGAGYMQGSEQR